MDDYEVFRLIDDIMVSLEMLEREVARLSPTVERKGIISNIRYWVERIRDNLVSLKVECERRESCHG